MRVSSLCFTLPVFALSVAGYGGYNSEYYSLGCPSSTKPWASSQQQLDAITEYGNLLYLQKQIDTAENTYVAKQFINHAPEISGNGTELAIKTLKPMLATSTIEIQRVFVGSDNSGNDYSVTYFKGISTVQGTGVIADIWRMIGTCKYKLLLQQNDLHYGIMPRIRALTSCPGLVEHWDVASGVQNSSNPVAYF